MCEKVGYCEKDNLRVSATPIDLQAIADKVNSSNLSWKAEAPDRFKNMTVEEIQVSLGTIINPEFLVDLKGEAPVHPEGDVPDTFDARTKWPNCKSIGTIRDQANCGSCWAHGTTEAYNDRACIADYTGKGPSLPL